MAGLGDADGDGHGDVAASWYGGDGQRVGFFPGGASGVGEVQEAAGDFSWLVAGPGDIDGDGLGDLVALPWDGDRLVAATYSAEGGLAQVAALEVSDEVMYARGLTRAGDVDGDGHADVVEAGIGAAEVLLGSPSGLGAGTRLSSGDVDDGFGLVGAVGDLDGDGFDDVAVSTERTWWAESDLVRVYPGSSAGAASEPMAVYTSAGGTAVGGDLDGDGYAELLVNRLDGVAMVATVLSDLAVGAPDIHLDGDGVTDLVVGSPSADP